jgi:hypothetical protein
MELAALKHAVPGLGDKSHHDKIKIFGWWMHVHKAQPNFTAAQVGKCLRHVAFPAAGILRRLLQNADR